MHDGHGHHEGGAGEDREKLVLTYMLEHNRHHVEELQSLADKIEQQGRAEAAALLRSAAADYEAGCEKLHAALHQMP